MIGSIERAYRAGACRWLAACALGAALVQGCSRVEDGGGSVDRSVEIDGSSTTYLVTNAVASMFRSEDPTARVSITVSGTGGGFKRFTAGETDISNASRPIKQAELERAQENGVGFIELPVAFDGITFAVSKQNDWADALSVDEIRRIFAADGGVRTWADIREGWPEREIRLFSPGYDSGTFDFFEEVVFADGSAIRNDMSLSEDDHIIARGIEGDRDALGFFGFAYYVNNRDRLRSVGIRESPGAEAVRPSLETIADGSYAPFARPLYIYVNAASAERDAVDAFVRFYLDNADTLAPEVGYAPLKERHYDLSRRLFDERSLGTVWLDDSGQHLHAPIDEVYGL